MTVFDFLRCGTDAILLIILYCSPTRSEKDQFGHDISCMLIMHLLFLNEGKPLHRHKSISTFIFLPIILMGCNTIPTPTATVISLPTLTRTPFPTEINTPTIEPTITIPPGTLIAVSTMDALVTAKPELGKYYSHDC